MIPSVQPLDRFRRDAAVLRIEAALGVQLLGCGSLQISALGH
jgi:hypothetical protein